jgi:toxin ParE1/3/4
MTGRIYYSDFVEADLEEISGYIAERNAEAAGRTIDSILNKFKLLAQNHKIGASRQDVIDGLRQFPIGNYNIFYFVVDDGVEIYRILHSARDSVQIFDEYPDQPN